MIIIKEATSRKEMIEYVKFPFFLYKNNKNWIPPLINDELETFDKTKNPVFRDAEAHFYLAYKENKIVGRIAAIINWVEVNGQNKRKVRFGWFDVIYDIEVTKALLEKVYEFGRKNNLEYVEGPMGFSNLDKVGVLTEGFDQMGTMITWYNYPYYVEHLEKLGYIKEKEFIEGLISFSNVDPDYFMKAQELVKKRYQLRPVNFKTIAELLPYVDQMFDLFNLTYSKLSSFVAISDVQKEYFKKKYITLINPEYVKYIVDSHNNLISFAVVMPNYSPALKKANGKLFPFGFLHLLWAKRYSKEAAFYLIGIHPDYQNKGVTSIIFNEFFHTMKEKGIKQLIRTPELEENNAVHNLWKNFNSVIHCRRKTFLKYL